MTPVFIFSLPRSGSTLLQTVISTHKEVFTVPEPWILLPLIYMNKSRGIYAEYNQNVASMALDDFINKLPNKKKDYYDLINSLAMSLYNKANSNKSNYFLDKTPRYYLIIDEIVSIFPDAKFIFLFRNPLSIYTSIIESFYNGGYPKDKSSYIDQYLGPIILTNSYIKYKNKSIKVNYETFVTNTNTTVKYICDYIGIEYSTEMINKYYKNKINGRMGDKIGINKYSDISILSIDKWEKSIKSYHRKKNVINYIKYLGRDNIENMGYSYNKILSDISNINVHAIGFYDYMDYYYSILKRSILIDVTLMKKGKCNL